MRRFWSIAAAMIAAFFIVSANPAMAQATRTWVSGVGDDANPCSRTAPCKTFAGAIAKTAAGGEIDVLDPGGFGTVTITKSITIRAQGAIGSVLASGTVGIIINAGVNDKIELDGLDINGIANSASPGISGIRILSARDVIITNTAIRNFATFGIQVNATPQVRVTIDHSTIMNNGTGISVTPASTATNSIKVSNTVLPVSTIAAISLIGPLAKGYIANTIITGTPKALDLQTGAVLNSYGNNVLDSGSTDAPTPSPLQ
jgi:hypothetical protein